MELSGEVKVGLTAEELWRRLSDPVRVSRALGAEGATSDGPDRWRADIAAPTGLGSSPFRAVFRITEREEGRRLVGTVSAQGGGHSLDVEGSAELSGSGDQTTVRYQGTLRLGGVLGSVAQRSGADAVRAQVERALRALAQ